MRAKLIKAGKIVGYTNVPDDTGCIVVNDPKTRTRTAMDTYLYSRDDDTFVYQKSVWIGLDEIKKSDNRRRDFWPVEEDT